MRRTCVVALVSLVVLTMPMMAAAQTTPVQNPPPGVEQTGEDVDLQTVIAEPDFTLGALPTTLRLPRHKMAFRITHRFTYKINDGSVGDFFDNFFGFDSSATIGFELRWGLASGTQLAVHRTNSKNIQFLAQHQLKAQRDNGKFSLDLLGAVEGQDNFGEEHSIVAGGVLSHQFEDQGSVYLHPFGVFNVTPEFPDSDRNTFVLGLGARFLIFKTRNSYVVAEFAPRLGGYDGGSPLIMVGLERRMGGHMFQLNVSNGFGTTLTQVGHGGPRQDHWHLGFNITRKFY